MKRSIVLAGNTQALKPLITELMAIYQLLEGLDIESTGDSDKPFIPQRKNKPEVTLWFQEDSSFVPGTNTPTYPKPDSIYKRVQGRISFRIMDEESTTLSEANAKAIGNKIKEVFGADGGYVWRKGKEMYSYTHWERGYQLQLLCRSKAQAKELVTKVLSIQNHIPDWRWFNTVGNEVPEERYPTNPPKVIILGKEVTTPRDRPLAEVRFVHAVIKLAGLMQPVTLYDRKGRKPGALVI